MGVMVRMMEAQDVGLEVPVDLGLEAGPGVGVVSPGEGPVLCGNDPGSVIPGLDLEEGRGEDIRPGAELQLRGEVTGGRNTHVVEEGLGPDDDGRQGGRRIGRCRPDVEGPEMIPEELKLKVPHVPDALIGRRPGRKIQEGVTADGVEASEDILVVGPRRFGKVVERNVATEALPVVGFVKEPAHPVQG